MTDHESRYRELMAGFRSLHDAQPGPMEGFGALHRAGTEDGAVSRKTKELIALAIAVAQRCEGCITIHAHDAVRAGATQQEADEALAVAIVMGGGPAAVLAAQARDAVAQFTAALEPA